MNPRTRVHILALVLLLIGLSACGFQLRGENLKVLQHANIFVTHSNAGILAAELKQQLLDADVKTVSKASDADYVVTLSNEAFRTNVLSVSPTTGKVEEYNVIYKATLNITNVNDSSKNRTDLIAAERDYTFDDGSVLGKVTEESVLRRDIAKQAAGSVLRQLRAAVQ